MRGLAIALCTCALLLASCAVTAPPPQLWDRWTAHDESNTRVVDRSLWNRFLDRYVTGDAGAERVRYGAVTAGDRAQLDYWLRSMSRVSISRYALREQRAYWINLYNAEIVRIVLDHRGITSVRKLSPRGLAALFAPPDPFASRDIEVEDQALSVNDIRDRILRPYWHDPRTLYALCDATADSPPLAHASYGAEYLGEQLDARAKAYINGPLALRWIGQKLLVSSFYKRYAADFGGDDAALLQHLRGYALGTLAGKLAAVSSAAGEFSDGSLNGEW
jgi:hypothetical protein